MALALNNLRWLMCHKTKLNQISIDFTTLFSKTNFSFKLKIIGFSYF